MTSRVDTTICRRCVMDTSDPDITFDADGVCSHCRKFDDITSKQWFPGEEGEQRLNTMLDQIRAAGTDHDYDVILGLSGGLDSSILAVRAKDWNLRVLAIHVDAGWNTELAVHNIQRIVEYCDFDLHTHVVDWADMRDLHLAYLRSGIANQDVPQDHVFFASLYGQAVERKIKYVLNGGNIATESVFPANWHGSAMDAWNLRDIHRKYGTTELKSYPTMGFLRYYLTIPYVHRIKVFRPLNFMPYDRAAALTELQERLGYKDYGLKHGESQFTRFFQNYYLPTRFGYDKRRPHLSSMILSGQITREEALARLDDEMYTADQLEQDIAYFSKKLRIGRDEFTDLLHAPLRSHRDFRNQDSAYRRLKQVQGMIEKITRRNLGAYG
ncbi:MAG: N-acetyl sugar amidotransferase [Ilumatobacter sp.]|nr:N-acetyl sugar amidotransferase [Ilumatobacter sp.]